MGLPEGVPNDTLGSATSVEPTASVRAAIRAAAGGGAAGGAGGRWTLTGSERVET